MSVGLFVCRYTDIPKEECFLGETDCRLEWRCFHFTPCLQCGCRTSFTLRLVSFSSLLKLPMDDKAYNTLLLMQVYARMSEVLGITDDNHVLETFMTKM